MHEWTRPSPAPEGLDGWYSYSGFKNLAATAQCTANLNIPDPKIWAFHIIRNNRNGDFHENGSNGFD
jgi:hypothetical protein